MADGLRAAIDAPRAAVGFTRLLRGTGVRVSTDSSIRFRESLAAVGWDRMDHVYWAARATLCRRPEDRERFDECFRAWFADLPHAPLPVDRGPDGVLGFDAPADVDATAPGHEPVDPRIVTVRFSRAEILRTRDFAIYSASDHDEARRVLSALRVAGETRRSRRLRRSHQVRRRPDVRRTVREALRTDGEPLRRWSRRPSERFRRLVVLCDVSGSMEPYSRVIIRFLHTAVVARTKVEAFALGTRVTRITRDLANRDPDAAIASATRRVVDWSGGTRLGETLRAFNDQWGVRGLARGAVVIVISDGWDRGDAELLGVQMGRLARVAHRIVWVNPLKASPGYEPRAAGMAAALPFVDDFVEGHSLGSLESLVRIIERSTEPSRDRP